MLLAIALVIFSHVSVHLPNLKHIDLQSIPPPSLMSPSSTCRSTAPTSVSQADIRILKHGTGRKGKESEGE